MNLRMKIVEQLMSSLFDDDREYLADCEDAALEIMKLIAAEQKPVESEGTMCCFRDPMLGRNDLKT